MKTLHKGFFIQVYDAKFDLYVCDNVKKLRNSFKQKGLKKLPYDCQALCTTYAPEGNRHLVLIYCFKYLNHNNIGHEIMHAAHGVMDQSGVKYGPDVDDEPAALLAGAINELVYTQFRQWKLRIK